MSSNRRAPTTFLDLGEIVDGPYDTLDEAVSAAEYNQLVYATKPCIDVLATETRESRSAFQPNTCIEYTVLGAIGLFLEKNCPIVTDAFLSGQTKLRDSGYYLAHRKSNHENSRDQDHQV